MGTRSRSRGSLSAEERAWLERLVEDLGPRLLAYVRRVYGNQQEAEDIVAETFCRAANNILALRASGRHDMYVLTIARNLCRDRFRRPHQVLPASERLAEHPGKDGEPHASVTQSEEMLLLRRAVAELPENLREVVVLRLSTRLRFEEIAELLHVPLGTALSRMHAAVAKLRRNLGCVHEH